MSSMPPHTIGPTTAIVVPCYNEQHRLDVAAFSTFLSQTTDVAMLFVNDGSRDETVAILRALAEGAGNKAAVLDLAQNVGKAEAVRIGMLRAMERNPTFVGFWDADLATPLSVTGDFAQILAQRVDIDWVFGARVKLLGRHIDRRAIRHYLGRVFATAVSLSLGVGVYDTQCGAKLFRATPEFRSLLNEPFLTRWIFDVELMARLAQARRQTQSPSLDEAIYEYPLLRWKDIAGSKVRSFDFVRAALELARIRLRYS